MLRVTLFGWFVAIGLATGVAQAAWQQTQAQEATPAASCPATSQEENEAVARRWYEDALNGADLAVLDEILSPDAVVYHSGSLATQDLAGIKDVVLAPILVGFPDVTYTIDQAISDEDDVVLIWHAEGTQTGEFQGFPASGKHATWTGINAMRFECGKIVEVWAEFNALGRLQQIGAIATPAP
jgi:steroid delta-isomerase-like uncharacterized protein